MKSYQRVLLIILIITASIIALASIFAFWKRDVIKNIVVNSINENLDRKVDVKNISFSIITDFPYASVTFEDVIIYESKDFITTGEVLHAAKISLLFSFKSILNKKYVLKKIEISDATLNLQTDSQGNHNYKIWKEKTDETNKDSLILQLQNVVLKNVDVLYFNQQKNQDITFLVNEGSLKGDFYSNNFVLDASAGLKSASVKIDEVKYLSKTDCILKLAMDIDNKNNHYTFRKSELKLAEVTLELSGDIKNTNENTLLDLQISSPSANLISLLSMIPKKYTTPATDYNYTGNIEFGGSIKGIYNKTTSPDVAFHFKSKNVSLNPKNTPYQLRNMNGKGYFTNKKNSANPVSFLQLQNFSASLDGKPMVIDLEVENFKKPKIKFKASLNAELKALSKFYTPDTLEDISGNLHADISFNGIAGDKSTYQSSGNIRFEKVNFKLKQKPALFTNFSGMIHLNANNVIVEDVKGFIGESDFMLSGQFNNLVAFLLLENQQLSVTTSIQSQKINLDELIAKDVSGKNSDENNYKLDFSEKLIFETALTIKELRFKKFVATDIKGAAELRSKILTTRDLKFNTANGTVRLKGVIDNQQSNKLNINYDADVNKLNINILFAEMGNFGQTVLVDKNLKGTVSAVVQFKSTWSNTLEIDENSIYAKSDITIENGELIDFEPMLALSRFVKGTDLKAVKFSTLSNIIEIKNRKVFIPLMEIKSSALDITASGEHSFDNIVDYKLQLYLSQILGRKVKQQNTEFGTIEDDGLGRTMLHLTMKGSMTDPKFKWDRNSVEQKISTEIKNESKTFKNILKEEFGKKDSVKKEPKKHQELQIDYEDSE